MVSKFQDLLSQHAASSLLKQQALGDFLGNHNWNIDMGAGTVDFGGGRVYPIQIVGTESEHSGTWLWAWANEKSGIPPQLLTCVGALRALGEKEHIEELTQPELELNGVNGHLLTMTAAGVCGADAYYRGPYEGGAVFFLIQQSPLQKQPAVSPVKLVNLMSSVISQFPVDHRRMAESFLEQQGYVLTQSEGKTVASLENNEVTVSFDGVGRMSNLATTVAPASESAARKSRWKFWR